MENDITISICIPTYEMKGQGTNFLKFSFEKIKNQTFRNFEVVVSDHSVNDDISNLCLEYSKHFEINYFRNEKKVGSSSANLNYGLTKCKNKIIKILFQDDFLYSNESLELLSKFFDVKKDKWLVSTSEHSYNGQDFIRTFVPKYNHNIHLGNNTISSPSVLTILNDEDKLFFDENLIWFMDCDYYKRCYLKFGEPKILPFITIVNRLSEYQVSNSIITPKIKKDEFDYVTKKFNT